MAVLFFYDLETTGLDPQENGIHQISIIVEVDGVVKAKVNKKVRPHRWDKIEPKALEVAKVDKETIMGYEPMETVFASILALAGLYVNKFDPKDKIHLVGYNNRGFDDNFLRSFFLKNGDKYFGSWFWSDTIDVMCLASDYLKDERPLIKDFKLATVAQYLQISVTADKLHDALYDVELTRAIYNKIKN